MATTTIATSLAAATSTSSLAAAATTSTTPVTSTSAVAAAAASTTSQAVVVAAVSSTFSSVVSSSSHISSSSVVSSSSLVTSSSAVASSSSVASSVSSSRLSSSVATSTTAQSTSTTATINSSSVLAFISQSANGSTASNLSSTGLKGGVIGGIVGGVVGGLILLFVVVKLLKRRRSRLGAERNPPPPPRDMAYIASAGMGQHHRNQSRNMNRDASYNNLMSPPLSHYGSQGMLKSSSGTPSEVGALDFTPTGESPQFFPRDLERGYMPTHIEPYSAGFPQEDQRLSNSGLMSPVPRLLEDATPDASSAPSSTPSPVPFDHMDGLAPGLQPEASISHSGDDSSRGHRTTASASRSASDTSSTSSPRLVDEGSQAHRSRSHNQLPRIPTHMRNLTVSTSASYGGHGAFSPGSRPNSYNSLSSMTGSRARHLSGTPHNGRAIVLSMPRPLSETTQTDGYLPPSPSMYGQYGQAFNEFGAAIPPSPLSGSSVGRGHRSGLPSLLSRPPNTDSGQ